MTSFVCKHCGECCKCSPTLTEEDVERIKSSGLKEEEFLQVFNRTVCMQTKNDWCKFLEIVEEKSHCKIYDVRPEICRIYPGNNVKNCKPPEFSFDKYLEERRKNEENRENN